jgi:hypothetical protein
MMSTLEEIKLKLVKYKSKVIGNCIHTISISISISNIHFIKTKMILTVLVLFLTMIISADDRECLLTS